MNNDVIKVQLSCGVDYYKGEKGDKPVKGVDYFTEQDINEIIERIEAGEIDLTSYATKEYVANAIEGMIVEETDPTVPEWAKTETKPSYTANEVGAMPADTALFSGDYEDLSNKPELFSGDYEDLSNKPNLFSGNYNDLTNKPTIPTVPSNVSAFYNDAGYLNAHQDLTGYATESYVDNAIANIELPDGGITVETDPTVPSWAKQANKPTYTAQEVGALPANTALFSGDYNDLSNKPTLFSGSYNDLTNKPSLFSGNYNDLTNKPTIPSVPVNISAFYNDAGYLTTHQSLSDYATKDYVDEAVEGVVVEETDPTVPSWAKQSTKPSYTASEVGALPANTALFSGDYNDLSNKPTIPTAYTLPTATTSTLGGVKVDGTTITISNGVISATSSGGGSYTAGDGIVIDNGEISVDFGNEIENGGFSFTQHYDNEDYYEYTSNIYPYEINITSYGEADPETGDQETKSISITGEGITFDDTGDSHTLGVSNGELVFDDSPIGGSGGSSNNSFPMFVSGLLPSSHNLTKQEIIDKLLAGEVVYNPPRGIQITSQELANHSRITKIGPYNVSTGTVSNSNSSSFTLNNGYYYYYVAGQRTSYSSYEIAGVLFESSTGAFGFEMPYADNQLAQQKTPYYLQIQIDSLNTAISSKQDAIIPSAPSTNGNYLLQATVVDGAVSYDWVSVQTGGSY